ncbi:MAG: glycosyltransferase family 4 protein [Bacteroidota bacterium]
MKVVFVLEHYHPYIGGAERLFQLLAEALVEANYEVIVVTTLFRKSLATEEIYNGVKIVRINCGNRFLFTVMSLPAIVRHAKTAQLIHTTTYNAALPAWLAARWLGKKVLVTFHEVWGALWMRLPFASSWQRKGFQLFEKLLLKLSFDHYVAVSNFTRQSLIQNGIPSHKISQIYNGLHYNRFPRDQHQAPANFTYTYFGRLGISKGLDLLLPAAARFYKAHPDSRLVLILPKRPRKMYQQIIALIDQLKLQEHVRLRHELSREELYEQICHSSCTVVPSYSEGFCFVAAETVALGVPIVSSGQGALAEVVSGPMIEMENMSAAALYNALEQAYAGQWSFKPVRAFPMQTALNQYLQLYKNNSILQKQP